jgi:hypothetical protein
MAQGYRALGQLTRWAASSWIGPPMPFSSTGPIAVLRIPFGQALERYPSQLQGFRHLSPAHITDGEAVLWVWLDNPQRYQVVEYPASSPARFAASARPYDTTRRSYDRIVSRLTSLARGPYAAPAYAHS